MSIESVIPSNHLIPCHPLFLLPSILSSIRVFSNESALRIRWPKCWSFSFSISLSNEYSGLISFRIDWFDLLESPRDSPESSPTPKFIRINSLVLNFLYGPTLISIHDYWKIIALTRWTFVSRIMSLLSNMLSRFVIVFLPRSKHLLISWLQSPSTVILEPKEIKSVIISTAYPSIHREVMGPDAMILFFSTLSFKPAFSLFSLTLIKRLFSSSLLSAMRVMLSAYLRLLIILPAILIPACASSKLALHKLKKQDENIHPWCTPFPILNKFIVPCLVLTVASWPA